MADTDLDFRQGPPYLDDGQDVHTTLPNIWVKNGDLFVRVDFSAGRSTFNQTVINGFMING